MFPRRRTLSFIFTLLSLNVDLVFVSSLGIRPAINVQPAVEYYPTPESPTPQLFNPLSTVAPAQRIVPEIQRHISNEALSFGSYPQGASINNGLGIRPAINVQPAVEYYPTPESPASQLFNSLSTVAPTNGMLREFVPPVQRIVPEIQRQISNEALSFGSYPQGASINNGFPINCAVPNKNSLTTYSTSSPYLAPFGVPNSLHLVQPTTDVLTEVSINNPLQIESLSVVDQNYPLATHTVQAEAYTSIANAAEVYPTPINVQIPFMPQLSPFIAVATPLPEILPSQTIAQEIYTPNVLPEIYQQPFDSGIGALVSVPVEATALGISSSDFGCYGQQLPFTLQINMASPNVPEPVITVISPQPQLAPSPSTQNDSPSFGMSPYPVVVMEKSKSKWKSILPILLLTLFDGGSGNSCSCGGGGGGGGGCCSQCSSATPVPFPIVIPVNNPIISGSSRSSRGNDKAKRSDGVSIEN